MGNLLITFDGLFPPPSNSSRFVETMALRYVDENEIIPVTRLFLEFFFHGRNGNSIF